MYKPTLFEKILVLIAQGIFFNIYFLAYLISPKTCHRIVGYLEEEATVSYTRFLELIDSGEYENKAIPEWSIKYWNLPENAKLRELVEAIRADEMKHRDVNHGFADTLANRAVTT
jgi:ubiquinol oxidase